MEGQPQDEPQPMPMQYEQQPPPVYMEQPKPALPNLQGLQQLIAGMNTQVLKEPRGFMKVLQFIFGICAFATTTSFSTTLSFILKCEKANSTVSQTITYPFEISDVGTKVTACDGTEKTLYIGGNFASDSRFFVAIGVLAFLYIIAALVLYCLFYTLYENNALVPLGDLAAHVFFAIMWLAASSAWANSLTALRQATNVSVVINENKDICSDNCFAVDDPNYSKLVISIILGFLNVFLWGSNLWFLYKETQFFKAKNPNPDGTMPNPGVVP